MKKEKFTDSLEKTVAFLNAKGGDIHIGIKDNGNLKKIEITMTKTDKLLEKPMKWYHYIAGFFSGVFLTNVIPHFVYGVSGNAFPTPFANPPGQGLSSPLTNVLWALFNLLAGYLLFRLSKINSKSKAGLLIFFAGIIFISIGLSITFMDKATE